MNRAARRRLARLFRLDHRPGPRRPMVRLAGGPMDGWIVAADAPALEPGWWKTFPPEWPRGRYVRQGDTAVWVPGIEQPASDHAGEGPRSPDTPAAPAITLKEER